jgi:hypothetical protein
MKKLRHNNCFVKPSPKSNIIGTLVTILDVKGAEEATGKVNRLSASLDRATMSALALRKALDEVRTK